MKLPRLRTRAHNKNPADNRMLRFVETLPIGDRVVLKILILLTIISSAWLFIHVNSSALVRVPTSGGTLTEGIVGTPRFINPVLAVTNADKDMVSLLYSGLMKLGAGGELVPDMAESVTVSDDGLVYNVLLREDLAFHDDTPVTADDVIFTVSRIQDQALKSPLLASWEGVTTEKLGEHELNFVLEQPYAPFIENLTLGILPRHIWEFATNEEFPFSQFNSEPIGSGPYEIREIVRNRSGIPQSYILEPFTEYYGKTPRINTLELSFFPSESALVSALIQGQVDSAAGLSPENATAVADADTERSYTLHTAPLPRTFAVFLNQNESVVLRDSAVREALEVATPRERIVNDVLNGYGEAITTPIPPGFGVTAPTTTMASSSIARLDTARDILRDGGWSINEETGIWEIEDEDENVTELRFSIATANAPAFEQTAEILKAEWEKLGVAVDVKRFEQSDLTQAIIRPRDYEVLLFGTVVGRELDFYSFWHSSQRIDPGLNVALYANITTDSILADARTHASSSERQDAYTRFAEELADEKPAIFLYVPEFIYVTPSSIENIDLTGVAESHERFSSITDWYVETESVWPFFAN